MGVIMEALLAVVVTYVSALTFTLMSRILSDRCRFTCLEPWLTTGYAIRPDKQAVNILTFHEQVEFCWFLFVIILLNENKNTTSV